MSKGSTRRPGTIPEGAWDEIFEKAPVIKRRYPNLENANLNTSDWRTKAKDPCVHAWDPVSEKCVKCDASRKDQYE